MLVSNVENLKKKLLNGDRATLSRCITLVESKRPDHKKLASELLDAIVAIDKKINLRIGITGVPGVGKSSFIDVFGSMLTDFGKKVAVLTIDPSSNKSKGSILGDKTRMANLVKSPNAFIRPSPSKSYLGGVAANTRDAMLLCEAAGYNIIIVETVGVGQSETVIKDMVDYFLLLMLSGGGDELQGIKRGIMEMADHIVINKCDGENIKPTLRSVREYRNAVHLFAPNEANWEVKVGKCSSLEKNGMEEIWKNIESFETQTKTNGWFWKNRKIQDIKWFYELIRIRLEANFFDKKNIKEKLIKAEKLIKTKKISVRKASDWLFSS